MFLAAITVWYFLVSDLTSGGEPKRSAIDYADQATCERQANFTHRTSFNVVVHLISARPIYKDGKLIGQYQRACYSETGPRPILIIQK